MLGLLCFEGDYCFGFVIWLVLVLHWLLGFCGLRVFVWVGLLFIWFCFAWLVGFKVVFGLLLVVVGWVFVVVGFGVACCWFWLDCVAHVVGDFLDTLVTCNIVFTA